MQQLFEIDMTFVVRKVLTHRWKSYLIQAVLGGGFVLDCIILSGVAIVYFPLHENTMQVSNTYMAKIIKNTTVLPNKNNE